MSRAATAPVAAVVFATLLLIAQEPKKAGGDDFLLKPHNRHVLGARVRSLLKLKGATDALEESLKRQRGLQKARDDLMRMVVHDLKTPLTSMLATLEMLRDGDFGAVGERASRALSDVEGARVGHVLETLRRSGRQHALVIDFDGRSMVRGIFSLSQIARQLGVALPAGGEVARTFSEIEAALVK